MPVLLRRVLILVLLDALFRGTPLNNNHHRPKVLILVLLDALFRDALRGSEAYKYRCLNPCFTGCPFQGQKKGYRVCEYY